MHYLFCVQRAEGMLKSWDALHQKERDVKCGFLQQKVKLQHDLIAKADQLSEEIRAKAMEEQQEVSGHLALSLLANLSDYNNFHILCLNLS